MLRTTNQGIVRALKNQVIKTENTTTFADYIEKCDENNWLHVDGGRVGRSNIMRQGMELIGGAQDSILFYTQFPPSPIVSELLRQKAKQGVDIQVVMSQLEDSHIAGNKFYKNFYRHFINRISDYDNVKVIHYPQGKVHAKLLAVDHKVALAGSHNLHESGVIMGTREVMLRSRDKEIVQCLYGWSNQVLESISDQAKTEDRYGLPRLVFGKK